MRARLRALLLALIGLPMVVALWLGVRASAEDARQRRQLAQALFAAQLHTARASVEALLQRRQLELRQALVVADPETLARLTQTTATVQQFFLLDAEHKLIYPDLGRLSSREKDFVRRTQQLWAAADSLRRPAEGAGLNAPNEAADLDLGAWYTWYWGNGLHMIYWLSLADGRVAAAEVDRARLLADMIALLPTSAAPGSAVGLYDARGQLLYGWGGTAELTVAADEVTLPEPLGAWRLKLRLHAAALPAGTVHWSWVLAGALFVVALGALAYAFYRGHTQELRQAMQRVTFVNQVAHELRTPLTNVRLYAELLERKLEDGHAGHRHVRVIVRESQRLSRLIENVLSFASAERGKVRLRLVAVDPDGLIDEVLGDFQPAIDSAGITLSRESLARGNLLIDRDVFVQVVGNLISNACKYAPNTPLKVCVLRRAGQMEVCVVDGGPGIPPGARNTVFEPFERLDHRLDAAVAGAGLGLGVARDLARLHGGDLLLRSDGAGHSGATFVYSFPWREPSAREAE